MSEHRCYGCMQLHDGDFCPHCGWPNDKNNEPHQLPVGTVLRDQYVVGRVLGQGGFGITYLGWDRHLESAVCIKEYFPNHAVSRDCTVSTQVHCHTEQGAAAYRASKERFLREGKILAQFREIPEIVSIYGFFEENDTVYIVMEYIKGMDLAHYVYHKGGRLSADETFRILKPVMEALAQVHRAELVHRDIAPDNIMLHPRGGAKLLDFGAARMVENADVERGLDRSTEAIVKHGFAPMEQYQTRGNLGPWTDVYAMCATVYYCLTGQIPPEATTRMMGEAEFSWQNVPGLTQRQRYALERGMAVLPRDRYASMEELLDGLFGSAPIAQTTPQPALAQTPVYRAPQPPVPDKKKKSGKGLVIGLAALLAVLVLGIGGFFIASMLQGALRGGTEVPAIEAPAAEAPVATEAPVAEAPMPEAPAAEAESCFVGVVTMNDADGSFGELLAQALAKTGVDYTLEHHNAGSTSDAEVITETLIAVGADAIVFRDDGSNEYALKLIADVTGSCGVPLILLGDDPAYDAEKAEILEAFPNVIYADMDPLDVAVRLAGILPQVLPDPDKNANGSISYVYLTGEGRWAGRVSVAIDDALNLWGYGASSLGWAEVADGAVGLQNALNRYGLQIEVIFCDDAAAVEMAYMICEEYGIDVWNEVRIVALGSFSELHEYYANGILAGYVNYSAELVAENAADVLIRALRRENMDSRYPLPCEVYPS